MIHNEAIDGSVDDSLFGSTTAQIKAALSEGVGYPAYRGGQIAEWLYRRIMPGERGGYGASFDTMTDLPVTVRDNLARTYRLPVLSLAERHEDPRDGTVKVLARLANGGHPIECVLLPEDRRVSVCLSTQAGCPMACAFCATGTQGLTRNLTAGEIVSQFLLLQSESPRRITHIVLMGMGEPLLNYDNTLKAIRVLNEEIGVAMRHITVSTVGIVPNIDRLAAENLQLTLAVSLHAPNDTLRARLVPVARTYPLERLMESCRKYAQRTHRRLTFEYVLLREVNDRPEDARELGQLLRGLPAALNVIPYNVTTVAESFQRPEPARVAAFRKIVEAAGVSVTERKERGRRIAAACGQLVTESARRRPARPQPVAGVAGDFDISLSGAA
ncbi:MAG: 23S rRNA (adenine(2503)-C(2))-methyltransferase RlmN [Capsulimonadaceae bacterium]